jgi:hypothetical protein
MAIKDNLLEIEVVYSKINKALDENISRLNTGATAVENYNKKISVVPSEYQKSLTEIKTKTDAVTQSSEKARLAEIKLQQAREKAFDKYEQSLLKQEQLSEKKAQKQINESNRIIAQKEKEFAKFEKEFNKYEADLAKQAIAEQNARKKQVQSILDQSKSLQSLNKQRESSIKQLEKEQLQAEKLTNTYEKVKAKINSMLPTYNDLKTKTELGIKLSAKESAQLVILEKRLIKYRGALNSVNKSYGNYSLEVGNYAKGTKNLNFAIAQISRELPNFGQSFEIGVLSLTNNIGAIIDGVKQVKNQNIELQSQGLKTQSVMKTVVKALFGWQTALFVGIGLFSSYSKEIGEFIKDALNGSKALNVLTESTKQINEARLEGIKTAQNELVELKVLLGVAKDETKSKQQRLLAVKELQETYPDYLGNLSKEEILAGKVEKAEINLTNALLSRAKAQAATTKITENQSKIIDLEEKKIQLAKDLEKQNLINQRLESRAEAELKTTSDRNYALDRYNAGTSESLSIKRSIANVDKEINDINEINNRLTSYAIDNQILFDKEKIKANKAKKEEQKFLIGSIGWYEKRIAKLTEEAELIKKNSKVQISQNEAYQTQLKVIDDLQKGLNKLLESKKEELKLGNYLKSEIYSEDYFDSQISNLESRLKLINKENEAYSSLNEQLQMFKDMRDAMYGSTDEQDKAVEKLEDFIDNFKRGFINSFKDNSGFGKLFDLFDKESSTFLGNFKDDAKATALAVSDAFQEAFNTIANANQQNFDLEYSLNEQRYQNALAFANGNAEAEEELAREKERREKEIAKREAQARKKLALFNITIDGAQALVAAAPNPFLMALVGALTVAQLALVSSQQIPEFWKGTENAPEGWAKTDERGAEIHTDSKGNIKDLGSDKGTRVKYLSKGDKIINAQKTKELISLSSFNKEYNDMLFRNQILPPIIMNNSNNIDLSGVESKLDKLVNKSEVTIVDDENGRRYFEKTQNSKMELKNSRIFIKSRNVRA